MWPRCLTRLLTCCADRRPTISRTHSALIAPRPDGRWRLGFQRSSLVYEIKRSSREALRILRRCSATPMLRCPATSTRISLLVTPHAEQQCSISPLVTGANLHSVPSAQHQVSARVCLRRSCRFLRRWRPGRSPPMPSEAPTVCVRILAMQ